MIQIRKILGKIKRKLLKTNRAFWFCKHLDKDHCNQHNTWDDKLTRIDCDNRLQAVDWIKDQSKRFAWIYNVEEIDYAERYNHLYPVLLYSGKIAGYLKVAVKKAYIEDYEDEITLQDDEAFIYDTYIVPDLRKKYLCTKLLKRVLTELANKDYSFVYCHIPGWNKVSSKLYQNFGFQRIGHIRYFRLMKYRFFSCDPKDVIKRGRTISLINETS